MKIFLNDRKVKEAGHALSCSRCIFGRSDSYNPYISICLLKTFNLKKEHDWCFQGYVYEDMA